MLLVPSYPEELSELRVGLTCGVAGGRVCPLLRSAKHRRRTTKRTVNGNLKCRMSRVPFIAD